MKDLQLRHFIICENISFDDERHTFTPQNVYEYVSAKKYPAEIELKCAIAYYFMQPVIEYTHEVKVYQNGEELGNWAPKTFTVDKPNEVMNIYLRARSMGIPNEGMLEFHLFINGKIVSKQFVLAVKEG